MKRRNIKESLWNLGYAGVFLAAGGVCIWLDHRFPARYAISMTAWGAGWLVLAAVIAGLTLREHWREQPRNLNAWFQTVGYAWIAAAQLYQGAAEHDAFRIFAGIALAGLTAAWLVRAVRQFRNTTHKEDAV